MVHERGKSSSHSKRKNVDYVLSSKSSAVEVNYRTRLTSIVRIIRLLLRQGLAFRGRDEFERSRNRGNFLELLKFDYEHNENLKNAFQSNELENDPLTSPSVQKEIIEAFTTETRKFILNEIGDKFFSLLIAGTEDSSVNEHMTVVLRFVNNFGEVTERFLGVVHVSDTPTQCLKNAVDSFFIKNGLSLSKLRGQSYDGVSNMREELNEVKTLILNENKYAHYIHCFVQQPQSVVVFAALDCIEVSVYFNTLRRIVDFLGASSTTNGALQQSQHDDVVKQGYTRWDSHYKTIIGFFDTWDTVTEVLVTIDEDDTDAQNRFKAGNLLDEMFTFEFVFVARLMKDVLGITNDLSLILQATGQKIEHVTQMIRVVKNNLQSYRKNGWEKLLKEVTKFCFAQEIPIPNMEDIVASRLNRRIYGESTTNFNYFCVNIFIKVIDFIAQALDNLFTESNLELLMSIMCLDPSNSFTDFDHERLLHLAKVYSEDFSTSELIELDHQLRIYISDVRSNEAFSDLHDIGALAKKMVEKQYHISFHLVYRLIELALILPVAKATHERSFSALNIFETELREQMGDDFFTDCLVCYIEKRIFVNIEDEVILQHFQNMKSRELRLSPIISSNVE
ncbi:uncharacterized protein [Euphorbia lathyris]|uniref:uncharacterized protein n=1 Tax=Euphorbia lathyris TaxID=212925 RepID=UPI0033144E10